MPPAPQADQQKPDDKHLPQTTVQTVLASVEPESCDESDPKEEPLSLEYLSSLGRDNK